MLDDAMSPPIISFACCLLCGDARIRGVPDASKLVAFPYYVQATKYTKSLVWESCASGGRFEGTGRHQCVYSNAVAIYRRKM